MKKSTVIRPAIAGIATAIIVKKIFPKNQDESKPSNIYIKNQVIVAHNVFVAGKSEWA